MGIGADIFRIGDQARSVRVLFQHPPSARLSYRTTIDRKQPVFEATAVIKKEAVPTSDGAGFRLELRVGDRIETLFEVLLDPRKVLRTETGASFRPTSADMPGAKVELLFSTDPGPAGDASADYAGWGDLRFVAKDGAKPAHRSRNSTTRRFASIRCRGFCRARRSMARSNFAGQRCPGAAQGPAFDPNQNAIVREVAWPGTGR